MIVAGPMFEQSKTTEPSCQALPIAAPAKQRSSLLGVFSSSCMQVDHDRAVRMAVNRFLSEGAIGQNISVQLEGATKCRVVGKGDAVLLALGGGLHAPRQILAQATVVIF